MIAVLAGRHEHFRQWISFVDHISRGMFFYVQGEESLRGRDITRVIYLGSWRHNESYTPRCMDYLNILLERRKPDTS